MSTLKHATAKVDQIGIGYRRGRLTVTEATDARKNGYIIWRCRCDCGGEILLDTRCLQRGTVLDCGCISNVKPGMKDLTGLRFGQLTPLYPTQKRRNNGHVLWVCRCELCGAETNVASRDLTSGNTKSCGRHAKALVDEGLLDGTSIRKLEYYQTQRFPLTTSGYTGVYQKKPRGKWIAQMKFQGKRILYQSFTHKEDAIAARKRAEADIISYLEEFYAAHPNWDRNYYKNKALSQK